VGVSEKAKFVVFWPFDELWDSLDLADAYHAQTFLAYNLNGQDLPADHGAPLRVRVARQLGYKSVKYLQKITVVESMKHVGDGRGSAEPAAGYSWYAGI
jgi:DMSO/TMAO reductase YedYZ molybdopterin-dependent catalytic subunit